MPVVPDFVIEVMSPSDRLKPSQAKVEQWISNGTALGWLIDGDKRVVCVYGAGKRVVRFAGVDRVDVSDGPVEGFGASMATIWAGF